MLFVLTFKGSAFFAGVLQLLQAALSYYYCVQLVSASNGLFGDLEPGPAACGVYGPGAQRWFIFDMVGAIIYAFLAWVAWAMLPMSQVLGGDTPSTERIHNRDNKHLSPAARARERGRAVRRKNGGRLRILLTYDAVCLVLCIILAVVFSILGEDWEAQNAQEDAFVFGWRFKATFFIARALYSLSSLPFLPFLLPVVRSVLAQCPVETGFGRDGRVRPQKIRSLPKAEKKRRKEQKARRSAERHSDVEDRGR